MTIGSVKISDPGTRRMIVEQLFKNFEPDPDAVVGIGPAYCFKPRLAIRASDAKGLVDLLICYECGRMHSWSPEHRESYILQGYGESEMRGVLQEAGIRIAPPTEVPPLPRSRVRIGEPVAEGELEPDQIRRIVRAHVHELRRCHEEELDTDPSAQTRFAVHFLIDADGRVSKEDRTISELETGALSDCILAAVGRWRFPRSRGGEPTKTRVPVELSPW